MTKWDDKSWQKEFLEMKFHSPADIKLLTEGVKSFMQSIYLVYLYTRWNKLKGHEKFDPKEKIG